VTAKAAKTTAKVGSRRTGKTTATSGPRLRKLSAESAATAADAGTLMDAAAPVRRCFVRADAAGYRPLAAGVRTPLSKMLAGGQGGEVRLKLYLSLLWLGARSPHAVEDRPASAWARLFGLTEPDTNGAQRVGAAITWLVGNKFATAVRTRGRPAKLTPRHERGKQPYSRPGAEVVAEPDWYFQLPQELWSKGWMGVLSGAGLVALVILWDESWGRPGMKTQARDGRGGIGYERPVRMPEVWLAEALLKDRYRISYDVWEKGVKELVAFGLVHQRFVPEPAGFRSRHRRRKLRLVLAAMRAGPQN
jgi:hypothetical protein